MKANIGHGLIGAKKDLRDFPLGSMIGHADVKALPASYNVSTPLLIKDQGLGTDMCTAYALTAVSEDQEGVVLDPFYTFARTRKITGADRDTWGADLRSACKSALDPYGFVEGDSAELVIPANVTLRNDCLTAYPDSYDFVARKHRKQSFYSVSGPFDFFNQIRSALWQTRDEERSVLTGIDWRPEWTDKPDGYVTKIEGDESYGHAIKIFGFESVSGVDFLVAQLSNGKNIGRGGIFSLARNVVNIACNYGGFTFLDIPVHQAQYELGRIGFCRYWINDVLS